MGIKGQITFNGTIIEEQENLMELVESLLEKKLLAPNFSGAETLELHFQQI